MDKKEYKTLQQLISLKNKAAIVTGGSKGIGQGIVYRLAEAGAKVLVADIDEAAANATVKEVVERGGVAEAIAVDVSSHSQVQQMVDYCKSTYQTVDILVNNAGIYPPKPLVEMTPEEFQKVIDVNLRSVFLTTHAVAEVMKIQGGGKIINITSIDALHPSMIGLSHYDASKHGVWGFTKNSALELSQYNICVNAIAPGGILTPGVAAMSQGSTDSASHAAASTESFLAKIPMKRMGESDEIGTVALFLASDLSSYMTGEQIVVDGGALLS